MCAIEYLLKPEIFGGNHYYVDVNTNDGVSRGHTFADKRLVSEKGKNTLVLETVNREKFVEVLINALEKLDNELVSK